jgi:hypothetical protein
MPLQHIVGSIARIYLGRADLDSDVEFVADRSTRTAVTIWVVVRQRK